MTSPELDNLVRIGKLKRESASDEEVVGLLQSAEDRLNDAGRANLSYSSRFDLAYNAAHALARASAWISKKMAYRLRNLSSRMQHSVALNDVGPFS